MGAAQPITVPPRCSDGLAGPEAGKEGRGAAQPIKGALEQGQRPVCVSRHPSYLSGACNPAFALEGVEC